MQSTKSHDVHNTDTGAALPSGFPAGGAGPSSGATGRPKRAAAQQVCCRSAVDAVRQHAKLLACARRCSACDVKAPQAACCLASHNASFQPKARLPMLQGGVRSLGDLQDEDGDSDSSGDQGNELFTGGAKRYPLDVIHSTCTVAIVLVAPSAVRY